MLANATLIINNRDLIYKQRDNQKFNSLKKKKPESWCLKNGICKVSMKEPFRENQGLAVSDV